MIYFTQTAGYFNVIYNRLQIVTHLYNMNLLTEI